MYHYPGGSTGEALTAADATHQTAVFVVSFFPFHV